ncbi:hypothetical protein C8F01DRAFT_1090855 [Mycena amicta]|nr:hypothetical protein C8F01DRAFT_1090855 [Mycena amicta]
MLEVCEVSKVQWAAPVNRTRRRDPLSIVGELLDAGAQIPYVVCGLGILLACRVLLRIYQSLKSKVDKYHLRTLKHGHVPSSDALDPEISLEERAERSIEDDGCDGGIDKMNKEQVSEHEKRRQGDGELKLLSETQARNNITHLADVFPPLTLCGAWTDSGSGEANFENGWAGSADERGCRFESSRLAIGRTYMMDRVWNFGTFSFYSAPTRPRPKHTHHWIHPSSSTVPSYTMDLGISTTPPLLLNADPRPLQFIPYHPTRPLHRIVEGEEAMYSANEVAAVHALATMSNAPSLPTSPTSTIDRVLPHRNLTSIDPRLLRQLPITLDADLQPRERPPTPFPYPDEGTLAQARRIQLALVAAQYVVEEATVPEDDLMEDAGVQPQGKHFLHENQTMVLNGLKVIDEPSDIPPPPSTTPTPLLPLPSEPPTTADGPTATFGPETTHPSGPVFESTLDPVDELARTVLSGIVHLGLPLDSPPTAFPEPLIPPVSELGEEFSRQLDLLLPETPALLQMRRAFEVVRQLVPRARLTELHSRVIAGVLPIVEQRAQEAQRQVDPGLIHGWVILFDAMRRAHTLLAQQADGQVAVALTATRVYRFWVAQVSREIDEAVEAQRRTHHLTQLLMGVPMPPFDLSSPSNTTQKTFGEAVNDEEWGREVDRAFAREMARTESSFAAMLLADELEDPNMNHSFEGSDDEEYLRRLAAGSEEGGRCDRSEIGDPTPTPTLGIEPLSYSPTPSAPSFSFDDHVTSDAEDGEITSGMGFSARSFAANTQALESFSSEDSYDAVVRELIAESRELFRQGRVDEGWEMWSLAVRTEATCRPRLKTYLGDGIPRHKTRNGSHTERSLETTMNIGTTQRPSPPGPENDSVAPLPLESIIHPQYLVDSGISASTSIHDSGYSRLAPPVASQLQFGTTSRLDIHAHIVSIPPLSPAVMTGTFAAGSSSIDQRPWYRATRVYLDNNLVWTHFPNRHPTYMEAPSLPLTEYAKAGAFKVAPLSIERRASSSTATSSVATPSPPSPTPTDSSTPSLQLSDLQPLPFTHFLAEMKNQFFPSEGEDSVGGRMIRELERVQFEEDAHRVLVFLALHKAFHHAYDRQGLGQLLDRNCMHDPDGLRVEYDWDSNHAPIIVDADRTVRDGVYFCKFGRGLFFRDAELPADGPHFDIYHESLYARQAVLAFLRRVLPFLVRQGADVLHAFYKWLQHCHYPTRRRRLHVHPFLHKHEVGLCEVVYSLLHENGYYREAEEFEHFLRVRYMCEEVLVRFLSDGYLDLDIKNDEQGYWTRDLPGLIECESPGGSANGSSDPSESDVSDTSSLGWLYLAGEPMGNGDGQEGSTLEASNSGANHSASLRQYSPSLPNPTLPLSRSASAPAAASVPPRQGVRQVVAPTPQYPLPDFLNVDTSAADTELYSQDNGFFDGSSEDEEMLADNEARDREVIEVAARGRWPALAQWFL